MKNFNINIIFVEKKNTHENILYNLHSISRSYSPRNNWGKECEYNSYISSKSMHQEEWICFRQQSELSWVHSLLERCLQALPRICVMLRTVCNENDGGTIVLLPTLCFYIISMDLKVAIYSIARQASIAIKMIKYSIYLQLNFISPNCLFQLPINLNPYVVSLTLVNIFGNLLFNCSCNQGLISTIFLWAWKIAKF